LKNLKWRAICIAAVFLVAAIYLIPSFNPVLPSWWLKILPKDKIHLGLDLQGGMHLILEVQVDKAVDNTVERLSEDIKEELRSANIRFRKVEKTDGWNIDIELADAQQYSDMKAVMEKRFPILESATAGTATEGSVQARYKVTDQEVATIRKMAADQALGTIRNRIDQFGVSEPDIRPAGENRIQVQLPGVQDPQRAVALIGKTALLEFKLVSDDATLQDAKSGRLPVGDKIYPMKRVNQATGQASESQIVLKDRTLMTGEYITDARVGLDTQHNAPYVALEFNPQGARLFERITEANVKKQLAIVLDGTVYSAPVIQEKIGGGHASITGSFTDQEAHDLAIVLRAGSLPAPVSILEQRTVGPSLGQDSIRAGLTAALMGGLATVMFMLMYYKMSGIIANVALILNIPLILAALAAFNATLTLPGIAGIILSVGMAVDANVLIFERIREELRIGKTPHAALDTGYSRATLTIIDSNVTTLIAAVVLFQFGTGPVRGFAITLTIGIIISMFTAIFMTRVVFDYLLAERRMRTISI
jgi:preprotein translocase subunit SecD